MPVLEDYIPAPLAQAVLDQYKLHLDGIHGLQHWIRVWNIGQELARSTGANLEVVSYFAFLHDVCRIDDRRGPAPRRPCGEVHYRNSAAGIPEPARGRIETARICRQAPHLWPDEGPHHRDDLLGRGPPGPWPGWHPPASFTPVHHRRPRPRNDQALLPRQPQPFIIAHLSPHTAEITEQENGENHSSTSKGVRDLRIVKALIVIIDITEQADLLATLILILKCKSILPVNAAFPDAGSSLHLFDIQRRMIGV